MTRLKKSSKGYRSVNFDANAQEFKEDIADLKPKVATLFSLVLSYDQQFARLKKEQKLLDFSDLEHMALRLLMEKRMAFTSRRLWPGRRHRNLKKCW